jgi:fido (protein-threonine AMPylation protein)
MILVAPRLRYHARMDDFERKWELIREQLRIQATGETPPRISSGRTLFGIRSEVEEKMDAIAREMEEKQRAKRLTRKDNEQSE